MAASTTQQYEFSIAGRPRLIVRNFAGNVTLQPGPAGQVNVRVTKRVRGGLFGSADEADLEQIRVEVAQSGDTIRVEAETPGRALQSKQINIDIETTAPRGTDIELQLNAGNCEIEGMEGRVNAKVNAGNLEMRDVTLANGSALTCNAGNLIMAAALAAGASVDLRVNAGNARLRLPASTAAYLDARTHAGSIDVSGFPVQVTRRFAQATASGALGANPQGTLTVRVDAGQVTLSANGRPPSTEHEQRARQFD